MIPFRDSLFTEFHKISQKYTVPEFVKSAKQKDLRPDFEPEKLHRVCADPVNLTYPCHTKAATWLSAAFLAEDYDTLPPHCRAYLGSRIEKFAEFHGISNEVGEIVENRKRQIKQASVTRPLPSDYYAFEYEENGMTKHAGAMLDEAGMQKAASWLLEHRDEMPLHQCSGIAQRIYKRAGSLDADVPRRSSLEQIIGFGFNDNSFIASALRKRAQLGRAVSPELSDTLIKMAEHFEKNPPAIGSKTMFKAACFVDEYDHRTGLVAKRARREISRPEEIFYRHTIHDMEKYAASTVKLQNGSVYTLDALSKLTREGVEARFGTEMADELFTGKEFNAEAAAAVLPTLPRPMADELGQELRSVGVTPDRQEKAASAITIPPEFFN